MKKHLTNIFIILVAVTGLSLLLYPTVSDYINSRTYHRAISAYENVVDDLKNEEYEAFFAAARAYNDELAETGIRRGKLSQEKQELYDTLLDITGTGIMGYIDIPLIDVYLPIYHGTDESVLQNGIGHLEWSSLPIGGESSHSILSGHTGLPSAKLFTNIDRLAEGDIFMIHVMKEVFTYEVDQILVVLPSQLSSLVLEDGKDYCTLVTCTPYGINTHRLLVRGHRIENLEDSYVIPDVNVNSEVKIIESLVVIAIIEVPVLLLTGIVLIVRNKKRKR